MFKKKKITIVLFFLLLYQSPLLSKSISFDKLDSKNLSKYFSGIVAFENKDNSKALNFFKSSKILINQHDPYLKRLVISLVLESKVAEAINVIKTSGKKDNLNFFEVYILLALDNLKKNNFNKENKILATVPEFLQKERLNFIILNSLKEYTDVFDNKTIKKQRNDFGNLSLIAETFQRCYLDDKNTNSFFSKLINNSQADYSRYIYFYLTHLIEKNQTEEAKLIANDLDYINTTLLLSQGKSWIERDEYK